MWEKKEVLVTVTAYPETCRKYGACVCAAGITREGEWIRMYPIPFEYFRRPYNERFHKYDWIEVECQNNSRNEKLQRKESYKIRYKTIRVIDSSLRYPKPDWDKRNKIILSKLNTSLEELKERFKEDRTSIGLIKPKEVTDFYQSYDLTEEETQIQKNVQMTLFGQRKTNLEVLPHVFRYKFTCYGENCNGHDITCEDWELLQSYRSWRQKYEKEELWNKLYEKYYKYFTTERDLYFYVGMYSQQPTWLIIGLYYPPKKKGVTATTTTTIENFI